MPQSLSAVYLHLVYSTKERIPYLRDPNHLTEMYSFIAEVSNRLECPALLIGGVWAKERSPILRDFAWQSGYGAFSVDPTNLHGVRHYIENQKEHHALFTFKEEYLTLLEANGVEWDERYVWE